MRPRLRGSWRRTPRRPRARCERRGALSGPGAEPARIQSGNAPAVPPAEQSAGDHPGACGIARGQGRRRRAAGTCYPGHFQRARRDDHCARDPSPIRSCRRLSRVPNQHIHTATRGRVVQTATNTQNCKLRRQFFGIAPRPYRQTVDVLGSVETQHAYTFGVDKIPRSANVTAG